MTKDYAEKIFAYEHLPDYLRAHSLQFYDLAMHIMDKLPDNAERGVALRMLLQAKDAAVRCVVIEREALGMSEGKYTPPSHEIAESLVAMGQAIEDGDAHQFKIPAAAFVYEAAERINEQSAEIERLRAALREISGGDLLPDRSAYSIAKEALNDG